MMMMMGSVGVKDIIFASREGFRGGGSFIYIYIYIPFFHVERKGKEIRKLGGI